MGQRKLLQHKRRTIGKSGEFLHLDVEAVIFDVDGTLYDTRDVSIRIVNECIRETGKKHNIDIETAGKRFEEAREMAKSRNHPGKAAIILHVEEIYNSKSGPSAGERIL